MKSSSKLYAKLRDLFAKLRHWTIEWIVWMRIGGYASSPMITYSLIIKTNNIEFKLIQLYSSDIYQKKNYLAERQFFIEIIEELN